MNKKLTSAYTPFFLLPAIVVYAIFFVIPILIGFCLAFTDWNAYSTELQFVGLRNFARTAFYLPSILSSIAIGLMFTSILHPTGLLNTSLRFLGLDALTHDWLVEPGLGIVSVALVEVWQWAGYHMAIFLAGLQGISPEYYEAATIDGAGWWSNLRYITLPLLMPAFSVNIVLSLIGGFKVFGPVYILTGGGPGYSTQVISTFVFKAFGEGSWALGTAANMILFFAIAIISMTVLRYLRRKEDEME